jgi:ParB family chromosome partitioning protein
MATNKGLGKGLGALLSIFDEEEAAISARKSPGKSKPTYEDMLEDSIAKPKRTTPPATTTVPTPPATPTAPPASAPAQSAVPTTQSAPISAPSSIPTSAGTPKDPYEVDISVIDSNLGQPRKEFDPDKLQELADSISTSGIIQPLILVPMGTRYMIVAGERRWRAAKLAGLRKVPAIIRNFTPAQIAEVAIVENLQRQDLNEIELARGIEKLISDFKLTQEQAAVRIGKSRTAVAHTLRLLTLPSEVIGLVEQGKLSAGHARCLVTLSDKPKAIKLAHQCVRSNLSVRDLERILQSKAPTTSNLVQQFKPTQSLELKELTRKLTAILLTKVSIIGNNHKGRITIDYFTSQDLMRIRKHTVDINDLVSVDELLTKRLNSK